MFVVLSRDDVAVEGATFDGVVEDQLLGDGPPWRRVSVVGDRPDADADGIVLACRPAVDLVAPSADSLDLDPPDWADVPHPPTPEDGPVMVVHVTRYAEAGGREAMGAYSAKAAQTAVPHGVQIAGWFDVDDVVAGDGREWDQVRFNRFPSKSAFMAVVFDPERLAAQADHREPALADTYTLIVRPAVDLL